MATGMWAVIGITSALHQCSQTGRGCEIDVSLFESALAWMTVHVANYSLPGSFRLALGSGAVITAPYQVFRVADGYRPSSPVTLMMPPYACMSGS